MTSEMNREAPESDGKSTGGLKLPTGALESGVVLKIAPAASFRIPYWAARVASLTCSCSTAPIPANLASLVVAFILVSPKIPGCC